MELSGTGDEMLLTGLDAPELQISDVAGIAKGITVNASNMEIAAHFYPWVWSIQLPAAIFLSKLADDYVNIHDNMIGTEADSFAAPPTAASQIVNIRVQAPTMD